LSNLTYLKIFLDWTEATEMLKDAEKGRLVDALVLYAKGQDADAYSRLSGNEAFLFPMFKLQVDRDAADLAKTSHTNSENGKKGGRPRKTEKTDRFSENRTVFTKTEKSQDKYKDKDKDKDKDYIETPLPPLPEFSSPAMQAAFESWLAYKRERREAYKPTGLKAFVSHLHNMIEQNGEQAVIDAINYSMAQGYQGIWQEDKRRSTATKAERTKDAFDAWQPDDEPPVVWEENV